MLLELIHYYLTGYEKSQNVLFSLLFKSECVVYWWMTLFIVPKSKIWNRLEMFENMINLHQK